MTNRAKQFLIVDDDPQNNFISKMELKKYLGEVEVTDFVIPEKGLEYIQTKFSENPTGHKTTLLLDLNMPSMTGWEFLEIFKSFAEPIRRQFDIYILSSSIDPKDIERAKQNPHVIDFIEKPLNKAILLTIFG